MIAPNQFGLDRLKERLDCGVPGRRLQSNLPRGGRPTRPLSWFVNKPLPGSGMNNIQADLFQLFCHPWVAFLRTRQFSLIWNFRQNEAERHCAAMQCPKSTAAVSVFVMGCAGILVCHAVSQGIVEQDRDFACRCGDRFCFTGTRCQPPIECPKSGVASPDCYRSQTQQGGCPAGGASRSR